MQRNTIYKLHLWLSVPLGVLITLICLSGAILVFKSEIRSALGMPAVASPHTTIQTPATHGKHAPTRQRDFFSHVTRFHTSLFLGPVGRTIVTYTTVAFVVILLSGIYIYWPRDARQWRQRLTIATGKGHRRLFYDLHVSLGFYVIIWLTLLALTGMAFGLHLLPKGSEAIKVFHEIHVGKWGGIVTKAITCAVSLVGASLPLTGYWLYFKKHRRNQP